MPKPGPRTTYKYSDEFKATAVRLSELSVPLEPDRGRLVAYLERRTPWDS
jgi:hypothetical protein